MDALMDRDHVAQKDFDCGKSNVTICDGVLCSLQRGKHVSRSSKSQPCVYIRNLFIRRKYATREDETKATAK